MRSVLGLEEALPYQEPAAAAGHPLASRLQAYSRLLALAADELAALESGDVVKRRELSEARDELMREIHAEVDEAVVDELTEAISLPEQLSSLLAEALSALELREEEERRMQDRWSSLQGDALKAMHVGGRIVSLRAGRYLENDHLDARLDVRF